MSTHRPRNDKEALAELAAFNDRLAAETAKVQEEYSAKWTTEKRLEALKAGDALPGSPPKFPIKDQEDMNNAARLSGNSSVSRATIVAHMKRMAKKHGLALPKTLQAA